MTEPNFHVAESNPTQKPGALQIIQADMKMHDSYVGHALQADIEGTIWYLHNQGYFTVASVGDHIKLSPKQLQHLDRYALSILHFSAVVPIDNCNPFSTTALLPNVRK